MFKKSLLISVLIIPAFIFGAFTNMLIDFNQLANIEESPEVELQNLKMENWRAHLNTSADFLKNRQLTYVKKVPCEFGIISDNRAVGGATSGYVLGVRANFPQSDYNAYMKVFPFHPIKAYGGEDGLLFKGNGMLNNVGLIKYIKVWVKGKRYPHSFYINYRDQDGKVTSCFLDYLDFGGWKVTQYKNMNYLEKVRDRRLKHSPEYPRLEPIVCFDSFVWFKDGQQGPNGDFVSYVGWIEVEYDKAIIYVKDDIDDEGVWQIQREREDERKAWEEKRLRRYTELIDTELQKMNLPPVYGAEDNRETDINRGSAGGGTGGNQ